MACGVEGPGTASEVALALTADKPVILLCATQSAREFFTAIGQVTVAATPEAAVRLIEEHLGSGSE